jgi:beta-carotene ketolase (CrtW type)
VCTLGFALFDFRRLARAHHDHHRAPASADDPDFHPTGRPGFLAWYARFVSRYVRLPQILGLALAFNVLSRVLGVPQANLFAFWVGPSLLAATQLFYFGTYLPHREPAGGYRDACRAESVRLPRVVSLLTCFHFGGFHHEHHAQPHVTWWRLPYVRQTHAG